MAAQQDLLDTPLLRVPYESLRRVTRDRKTVIEELQAAAKELKAHTRRGIDLPQHLKALDAISQKLTTLKRKVGQTSSLEAEEALRCKQRSSHLVAIGRPEKEGAVDWTRRRIDRLVVDHLMRSGYVGPAELLAQETGVQPLVELHIFRSARGVLDALLGRHSCEEALAWCAANRAKLRKAKSRLEFQLRKQEFVELVRGERMMEAIAYARKHLAPWAPTCFPELQHVMAALAFRAGTTCRPYAALFEPDGWQACAALFCQDLYRLHSLPAHSTLAIHLQAGLSALKPKAGQPESCSKEDPMRVPALKTLAEPLPCAKHVHSTLVCGITRDVMNENNPPMVAPNGMVYSKAGVLQVAAANGGKFLLPNGALCNVSDFKRLFIT